MANLAQAGISIDVVTNQLLDDGIQLFATAFDRLLDAIERKLTSLQPHVLIHRVTESGHAQR
jgi:transaldolase/glucose-6-phosphate isomerase